MKLQFPLNGLDDDVRVFCLLGALKKVTSSIKWINLIIQALLGFKIYCHILILALANLQIIYNDNKETSDKRCKRGEHYRNNHNLSPANKNVRYFAIDAEISAHSTLILHALFHIINCLQHFDSVYITPWTAYSTVGLLTSHSFHVHGDSYLRVHS